MPNQSLDGIEEELARTERKLADLRETLKRSHRESSADDASLREMGARVKELMGRPKTWKGGSKRADATELERLRAEMRTRSEAASRHLESMKAISAEVSQLSKRHQDLSKTRAEIVARGIEAADAPPGLRLAAPPAPGGGAGAPTPATPRPNLREAAGSAQRPQSPSPSPFAAPPPPARRRRPLT